MTSCVREHPCSYTLQLHQISLAGLICLLISLDLVLVELLVAGVSLNPGPSPVDLAHRDTVKGGDTFR